MSYVEINTGLGLVTHYLQRNFPQLKCHGLYEASEWGKRVTEFNIDAPFIDNLSDIPESTDLIYIGTNFYDVQDIMMLITKNQPKYMVLDYQGQHKIKFTEREMNTLVDWGYVFSVFEYELKDFGLPQDKKMSYQIIMKTELYKDTYRSFQPKEVTPLHSILRTNIPKEYHVTEEDIEKWKKRKKVTTELTHITEHTRLTHPLSRTYWHGTSSNIVLKSDGLLRRLTDQECLRLQGVPEDYNYIYTYLRHFELIAGCPVYPIMASLMKVIVPNLTQ